MEADRISRKLPPGERRSRAIAVVRGACGRAIPIRAARQARFADQGEVTSARGHSLALGLLATAYCLARWRCASWPGAQVVPATSRAQRCRGACRRIWSGTAWRRTCITNVPSARELCAPRRAAVRSAKARGDKLICAECASLLKHDAASKTEAAGETGVHLDPNDERLDVVFAAT
jgi:hypothetical protein